MWLVVLVGLFIPSAQSLFGVHLGSGDNLYASPCPEIFHYFLQDGVLQYGIVKVDCPDDTTIQLHVELSVGNQVQGYNGDLVLAASREETIQNIIHRKPIMYRLNFPRWYNYPPKVTKIMLNGMLICQGPPIDIKAVRILTTINLHHTLKLNIAPDWRIFNPPPVAESTNLPMNPTIDFRPSSPPIVTRSTTEFTLITPEQQPQPTQQLPWLPDRGGFGVNDDQCGITSVTNTLIAHGRDVLRGEYPWLVAIFQVKNLGPEFVCGANLISHRHVITAGHCMKHGEKVLAPDQIFMRIGEHNIHKWTQTTGSKWVGAERILVHSDYKSTSADGDLALLVLTDHVEYSTIIRPICLWRGDASLDRVVGRAGTVVGWGRNENDNQIAPEPKQIQFPVVSQEECLRSHFTFREITSDRTFCAGYKNGSGPCNGDSGGGFIMQNNGRWYLRGLVSMSIANGPTCDFSQYFVFTDVTKFQEWIHTNL